MAACEFFDKTEEEIVKEYSPLVVSQALKFRPNKLTGFEDYLQAGFIGLLRAVRKFDPSRNVKFSTFSVICIKRQILKEFKKLKPTMSLLHEIECESKEEFWELHPDCLSETEKKVIALRLKNYTYEQIGNELNFTKSWASEVLSSAIKKIKEASL